MFEAKGLAVFKRQIDKVFSFQRTKFAAIVLASTLVTAAGCRFSQAALDSDEGRLSSAASEQQDFWDYIKNQIQDLIRKMKSLTRADAKASLALADSGAPSPTPSESAQLNQALLDSANAYYALSRDVLVILRDMKTNVQEKDVDRIRELINTAIPMLQNLAVIGVQVLTDAKVISPGMQTEVTMAFLRNLPGIVNTQFNLLIAVYNRLGPNEINMIIGMLDALMGMINSHADILDLGKPPIDLGEPSGAAPARSFGSVDCKDANWDGLTCKQLNISPGQTACKNGSVWKCESVCVHWQSPGFCQ